MTNAVHGTALAYAKDWDAGSVIHHMPEDTPPGAVPSCLWPRLVELMHVKVAVVEGLHKGLQEAVTGTECHYIDSGGGAKDELKALPPPGRPPTTTVN